MRWSTCSEFPVTNTANVSHQYKHAGIYNGKLISSNIWGCSSEISFTAEVPEYLFIPNVFTPNNDGFNDTFVIQYNGIADFILMIFNRWGEEVFVSNTRENQWNGFGVPSGTYFYRARIGGKDFKGWVAVLR